MAWKAAQRWFCLWKWRVPGDLSPCAARFPRFRAREDIRGPLICELTMVGLFGPSILVDYGGGHKKRSGVLRDLFKVPFQHNDVAGADVCDASSSEACSGIFDPR